MCTQLFPFFPQCGRQNVILVTKRQFAKNIDTVHIASDLVGGDLELVTVPVPINLGGSLIAHIKKISII
jgi:chorismate synthase